MEVSPGSWISGGARATSQSMVGREEPHSSGRAAGISRSKARWKEPCGAVEGPQASQSVPGQGASHSVAWQQRPCDGVQARPRDPNCA